MTDDKLKLIKRQIDKGNKVFEAMLDAGWQPETKPKKEKWFSQKIDWYGEKK
jgi:hypothetical protein